MGESTEKKRDKRLDNLKPWPPGKSANPKGRPRGSINITNAIKRVLASALPNEEKRRQVDLFAEALVQNARKGNGTAIKEIMARVDGPVPTVHEGGDPAKPVKIIVEYEDDSKEVKDNEH